MVHRRRRFSDHRGAGAPLPVLGLVLLNGIVTFLLGVIIYRNFPESGIWVIGLLVGLEMLFHGWTWIMLSLAIRRIPAKTA